MTRKEATNTWCDMDTPQGGSESHSRLPVCTKVSDQDALAIWSWALRQVGLNLFKKICSNQMHFKPMC